MTYLLHAITRSAGGDDPAVASGTELEFIGAGALGAWATAAPDESAGREDALEHHRMILGICATQACLPVRFGTRLSDAAAVRTLLERRCDELLRTLDRVGHRQELAVTLLWADDQAGALSPPTADVDRSAIPTLRDHPGRIFLQRKQRGYAVADERRAAAGMLAGRLCAELATDQADVRHAICPSAEVALSTAILAPAGGAGALKERALKVVSELPGVRGVVSGPWPPYTFAGTP